MKKLNLLVVCLSLSIGLVGCTSKKGIITLTNKRNEPVKYIRLFYKGSGRIDKINDLLPNESYDYPIHYTNTEDSISIQYLDNNNNRHEDSVIGYFGNYDKQHYKYDIK